MLKGDLGADVINDGDYCLPLLFVLRGVTLERINLERYLSRTSKPSRLLSQSQSQSQSHLPQHAQLRTIT